MAKAVAVAPKQRAHVPARVVCSALNWTELPLGGCESIRESDDHYANCPSCEAWRGVEPDGLDDMAEDGVAGCLRCGKEMGKPPSRSGRRHLVCGACRKKEQLCRYCGEKMRHGGTPRTIPESGRAHLLCRRKERTKVTARNATRAIPIGRTNIPQKWVCSTCGTEVGHRARATGIPERGIQCRPCQKIAYIKMDGLEAEARVREYFSETRGEILTDLSQMIKKIDSRAKQKLEEARA